MLDEEEFLDWFCKEYAYNDFTSRMCRFMFGLVVLTSLELLVVYLQALKVRLVQFLTCRGLSYVVLFSYWILARRGRLPRSAVVALSWLTLARCLLVTFMICSYGCLEQVRVHVKAGSGDFPLAGVSSNVLHPISVFTLAYLMTKSQFLLLPSLFTAMLPVIVCRFVAARFIPEIAEIAGNKWFIAYTSVAVTRAYLWEVNLQEEFKSRLAVLRTKERVEEMLYSLLPPMIVDDLFRHATLATSHFYPQATIAQSDLCGFTRLASSLPPEKVVKMIGEIFQRYDELAEHHNIYKVETVGDAYIAGQADAPLTRQNAPWQVVLFGLGLIRTTLEWSESSSTPVTCRVGIHTGPCVGGVVGMKMQRYHLFGQLIDSLEVLESTAPEGRVQVSSSCRRAAELSLEQQGTIVLCFEERSERTLTTSKGVGHNCEKVGGRTHLVSECVRAGGSEVRQYKALQASYPHGDGILPSSP